MRLVWPDAFVEEANLSQNVFVLRKALGERPKENRYIATIPGRGYCFVANVADVEEGERGVSDQGRARARGEGRDLDEELGNAKRLPPLQLGRLLNYAFGTAGMILAVAALGVTFGVVRLPWLAIFQRGNLE